MDIDEWIFFIEPTTVLSEGMKNIIEGMKKNNVEVVSVCLSGNNTNNQISYRVTLSV